MSSNEEPLKSFKSRSTWSDGQHTILWTKQKNKDSQIETGNEDIRLKATSPSALPSTGPVAIGMEAHSA